MINAQSAVTGIDVGKTINKKKQGRTNAMMAANGFRKKVKGNWNLHFRRIYVMILNALLGHNFVFSFIGFFSSTILRKPIKSVFLMYPGQKKYSEAYVYEWYRKQMQWKPRLVGFLWQNNGLSFSFAISACDEDIWGDKDDNLQKILHRMEEIRVRLRAGQKTFAGILPGVFCSKGLISNPIEVEVTVSAVVNAIENLKEKQNFPTSTLVIVLGGAGFIGSKVVQALKIKNSPVISIDLGNVEFFTNLKIENAILLNVTQKGGLRNYISNLHPGVIVLNEVYPPPRRNVVDAINAKGSKIFHINGLKGGAIPSFPHDYAGGIPCCAGYIPDDIRDLEVVLTEL